MISVPTRVARRLAMLLSGAGPMLFAVAFRSGQSGSFPVGRASDGVLVAAGVLVLLVWLAGTATQTRRSRPLRWAAAGLLFVGVGAFFYMSVVSLSHVRRCNPDRPVWEIVETAALGGLVVAGSLVWPLIVREAPGRWTRWLIGPAAGVYLLASAVCVIGLENLVWTFDDCGG